MAFTQTDLNRINNAIASGQRSVQLNGRRIEYQNIVDMLKARDAIQKDVNEVESFGSGVLRPRGYRAKTAKGL